MEWHEMPIDKFIHSNSENFNGLHVYEIAITINNSAAKIIT